MNLTEKEKKEIAKAGKTMNKVFLPGYMAYMLTILSMVYIVDEIASNICNSLQSDMVTQFYVNAKGLDFNTGLATY